MSDLYQKYTERYNRVLVPVASALAEELTNIFSGTQRIDRISARAKSIDRFVEKAQKLEDGNIKYDEPLDQIQDQIGARIITFYKSDVEPIIKTLYSEFRPIESKDMIPPNRWQFGYFGWHSVLLIPTDLHHVAEDQKEIPRVFEIQVKTLFQHAWSEANHDLGYKPGEAVLEEEDERMLAFTSAQAWGADRIFDDLFRKGTK